LLTVGVVGGLSTVRDALNTEMGSLANAITSLDPSYVVPTPALSTSTLGAVGSTFNRAAGIQTSANMLSQSNVIGVQPKFNVTPTQPRNIDLQTPGTQPYMPKSHYFLAADGVVYAPE
jgi:hypothetical protein